MSVLGSPVRESKFGQSLDWNRGHSWKNCRQVAPHRDLQPPAAFHHGENRRDLWPGLQAANVNPIAAPHGERTHRVLSQIVAQLQFGVFQEARELVPKGERVLAGFRQPTARQYLSAGLTEEIRLPVTDGRS